MTTDSVVKINKEHEQQDFVRAVAIFLANEEATPTDILERDFSKVEEKNKEYLLVSGQASVNYTCSAGYDRKEEYYEKERKYDSNIKDYRYVEVKKTRTVTDWRPHSGSNTSKESVVVGNGTNQNNYRREIEVLSCYQTSKEESKEEYPDELSVNSTALEVAEKACVSSCFHSVRLPGDRQKETNYSGTLDISDVSGLIVPEFEMSYDYQGTKYKTKGFAAGDIQVRAEYPSIAEDVSKQAKKSVRIFKLLAIAFLIVGVILNLFMDKLGSWCFAGYGAALLFLILYISRGNAKMKSIYAFKKEEKKKDLIDFLAKKGLKPLTTEELALFENTKK